MNKIVYLNIPAYGHVNATLPVVQELVQRGEQVIYYNTEEFRPQIERTGATFRPYPAGILSSKEIAAALEDGSLANVSVLLLRVAEKLMPFMLEELRHEAPDLVVYDATVMWGRIASKLLNLRSAASITTFVLDVKTAGLSGGEIFRLLRQAVPKMPRIMAARMRLTRRYGKVLSTNGSLFPVMGDLNIVFTSRELQPDMPLIDDSFRFVGLSINPQTRREPVRGEDFPFDSLGDGRVIYISLGTIHHSSAFYKKCFEAFEDYPAQFILSAGKDTDIAALGAIPSNFIVRPSVPQLEVLERVDAFITHGGINSVQEGLYNGVPLVVVPQQFEQLMNARVVTTRGAGLELDGYVTGDGVTAVDLRQSLEKILTEMSTRETAKAIGKTLREAGGYRKAADELQAFAAKS
jgi:MGT family glycosyltransferase